MPRSRPKTAAEFVRELAANPEYQARFAEQKAAIARKMEIFYRDADSLSAELAAMHVHPSALETYFADVPRLSPEVVAVLARHLEQPHVPAVFEAITRSLARSDARDALPALERCFVRETVAARRWLLANAIGTMAKLTAVAHLPGIGEYAPLFRRMPRKPPHQPLRPNDR